MSCLIKLLTPDGLLKPVDYHANSLVDAARFEPHEGVYTIANTFNTFQVLKLDAHLDRLENSARLAHIPLTLDRPRLRKALRDMIAEANWGSVRFRITVPAAEPESALLSIEPFNPPAP